MTRSKIVSFEDAARLIPDGAVVAASSSSGLACPDRMLAAIGERFVREGHPRGLTFFLPIAAGDMYGIKGIDHVARKGLLAKVIAGSYPSGPSSMESPAIWKMIAANEVAAYNVPSGILFDMLREGARIGRIREIMGRPEYAITVDLGLGRGEDRVWTCDLSEEYVRINAKYTT